MCLLRHMFSGITGIPNTDLLYSQHVIMCSVKCEIKSLIHSQTLTTPPFRFENGYVYLPRFIMDVIT